MKLHLHGRIASSTQHSSNVGGFLFSCSLAIVRGLSIEGSQNDLFFSSCQEVIFLDFKLKQNKV